MQQDMVHMHAMPQGLETWCRNVKMAEGKVYLVGGEMDACSRDL
jgi:hypothetical protein